MAKQPNGPVAKYHQLQSMWVRLPHPLGLEDPRTDPSRMKDTEVDQWATTIPWPAGVTVFSTVQGATVREGTRVVEAVLDAREALKTTDSRQLLRDTRGVVEQMWRAA